MQKYHDVDKRLSLVEQQMLSIEKLTETAEELKEAVSNIKTEYAKMKAYSKGRNWVLGIWCAATGIVCTGLFMLGQVILSKTM